jgi:hypothetical protein
MALLLHLCCFYVLVQIASLLLEFCDGLVFFRQLQLYLAYLLLITLLLQRNLPVQLIVLLLHSLQSF